MTVREDEPGYPAGMPGDEPSRYAHAGVTSEDDLRWEPPVPEIAAERRFHLT